MHQGDDLDQLLTWDDCWRRIRRHDTGRLAWGYGPSINIAPTAYLADGQTIYLPTAAGGRTLKTGTSPWVAFEIDGLDDGERWSVLVQGPTRAVASVVDDDVVGALHSRALTSDPRTPLLRLDPVTVTGWATFPDL